MALYLLDSDAVIDELHRVPATGLLLRRLTAEGQRLCTCDVVIAEIYAGLQPKDEPRAQGLLSALLYLTTSQEAAQQAGRWRYQFARAGLALASTDVLIAATALSRGATIVTGNVRHFPMLEVSLLPLPR